jgi:curved DNA-binding protein
LEYKDYYKIMGLDRDATQDDIKRAYRKLARKYHPDVSKEEGAQSKFQEMQEAYEVLKDPEKRAAYDQLGANWRAGQDFRPPPDWDAGFEFSGDFGGAEESVFSDFFESLFGRRGRSRDHAWGGGGFQGRGQDHHARILVDLEDAFHGATRSVTLQTPTVDESGHVRTRPRTLSVRIPKGVKQGQQIRLSGQGSPGIGGGRAGDLYLEIEFKPHPVYRVEGADLYMDLPVAPWEAALGAKVKVPTPGGTVDLTIAPGSKAGTKLRLRGRGIPARQPGNLYVTLQIALPPAKDDRSRRLYEQMREQMSFNPRAALGV